MTIIALTLSDEEVDRIADAVAARLAALAPPASKHAPASDRLTIKEAAAILRCSTRSVRRLISSGRLRAVKVSTGGSSPVLIARRSVDALLAEDA